MTRRPISRVILWIIGALFVLAFAGSIIYYECFWDPLKNVSDEPIVTFSNIENPEMFIQQNIVWQDEKQSYYWRYYRRNVNDESFQHDVLDLLDEAYLVPSEPAEGTGNEFFNFNAKHDVATVEIIDGDIVYNIQFSRGQLEADTRDTDEPLAYVTVIIDEEKQREVERYRWLFSVDSEAYKSLFELLWSYDGGDIVYTNDHNYVLQEVWDDEGTYIIKRSYVLR